MKIWDRAESLFDKAHEELKDDIRTDVQDRTWEIFSKLFKRSE